MVTAVVEKTTSATVQVAEEIEMAADRVETLGATVAPAEAAMKAAATLAALEANAARRGAAVESWGALLAGATGASGTVAGQTVANDVRAAVAAWGSRGLVGTTTPKGLGSSLPPLPVCNARPWRVGCPAYNWRLQQIPPRASCVPDP